MNKFGPHFQRYTTDMRELIVRWQPPVAVWVDPNRYGVEEIRSISPGTFIIGRKFEQGNWDSPNLKDRAYYWADECARMGPCDAYYCWNEPLGHDDRDSFGRLDDFHMWFRERILTHGIEAVGLNVGTGNFTVLDDIAECFPQTCSTFKHLGIHEYDWIIDPAKRPFDRDRCGYYWMRWPYWLEDIGRDDVSLWVTECGMTQAVHEGRPDEGWRSGADGMTDGDYIAWADWYNKGLVKATGNKKLGGAALFNFAGYGWETFEHLGWERLGEILALDAPEPNGGNGDMVKIYDFDHGPPDGATTTWDWLRQTFGDVQIRAIEDKEGLTLQEGDVVYKLDYLDARVGDANIIINVRDRHGEPVQGETVVFGWPDAPAHDHPDKPSNWTANGVTGDTNENGDVGPGLGTGAYYCPSEGERGPHFVWVYDLPSDYVDGLGMMPGGCCDRQPHPHLNLGYRAVEWSGGNGNGGGHAEQLREIAGDLYDRADALFEIADELENGGGGVDRIVLHWKSGTTQDFKAVKSATQKLRALLSRLLGR